MAKIAVLLPREEMLEQAKKIIQEEHMAVSILKVIKTTDSVFEARNAVEKGAEIIVARGVQASYIKKYLDIPLVEVEMTAQELALLIKRAKKMVCKERPSIAVIGNRNLYSDTSYFSDLFDIEWNTYFTDSIEDVKAAVDNAKKKGIDLLIGGDVVNGLAKQKGMLSLFIESTEDSIRNALKIAKRMSYTAEVEKNHTAQFQTVLDTSFNGILKIDNNQIILNANHSAEILLGKDEEWLKGRNIVDVIPEVDAALLESVLAGKRDTANIAVRLGEIPVMVSIGPIQMENEISGAILSCYKLGNLLKTDDKSRTALLRGYRAKYSFTDLSMNAGEMKECIERGKVYALSSRPVLIYGESGTEKEMFAQCIHNSSAYKGGPFVSVNLAGMTAEMQMVQLFGDNAMIDETSKKGALAMSDSGTLLLSEIENLTMEIQYRLYRAIRYKVLMRNDLERCQTVENRIIVTSEVDLWERVKEGKFRKDLYYFLQSLVIQIPPLRCRKKNIEYIINKEKKNFAQRYSRFFRIPEDTLGVLEEYEWPGNEIQLYAFLDRLFWTTPKKTISEAYTRHLLEELYPKEKKVEGNKEIIYRHPEAAKITELLKKYNGKRSKVAKELGISTTTLWRHMKKYGIIDSKN